MRGLPFICVVVMLVYSVVLLCGVMPLDGVVLRVCRVVPVWCHVVVLMVLSDIVMVVC